MVVAVRFGAVAAVALLAGCVTTPQPVSAPYVPPPTPVAPTALPPEQATTKLTLGLVQTLVKKGASKESLLSGLGSPNMVTQDSSGQEMWVYDRVSSEVSAAASQSVASAGSSSGGGIGVGIGGAGDGVGGALGAGGFVGQNQSQSVGSAAATTASNQRSLTVVITFKDNVVDSFKTRSTSF